MYIMYLGPITHKNVALMPIGGLWKQSCVELKKWLHTTTQIHRKKLREPERTNTSLNIKAINICLSFSFFSSFKVHKLCKVIVTTIVIRTIDWLVTFYCWVCNIYRCSIYNNSSTKRGERDRSIWEWCVCILLELV